ncbi:type II toxin-antitoxin system Phd/YefM family antitoxin [Luteimonas sp. 8-5]|jgi:prevent-host-death family protein|uniref:type II toxin-antitoxin system Phd/YefM family antitoxin n=1 Tax=Luteimonas sp. 8-5 TaxID=3039387 RepID=UPI00243687C7|nr:type II toxin-antitoxin system Phd/YefM family antitoxin [Luteimonas sp. 8-5]MDG6348925.1 type II toxin-antitoxin system Phd/YefM family antitoxin [Luteimonas sp. 8-5]
MAESVISLSDFKSDASQWLKQLQEDRNAVVLTQNGRGSAVVQSYESFRRQQDSLAMLKLMAQGEADIREGRAVPQVEAFASVRSKLAQRGG